MARVNKMSVLKRQRERKKAEKAALKRELRSRREDADRGSSEPRVATREDLAGYGLIDDGEGGEA